MNYLNNIQNYIKNASNKTKLVYFTVYSLFLVVFFSYVNYVINIDKIKPKPEKNQNIFEQKDVKITVIFNENIEKTTPKIFNLKHHNTQNVNNLIKHLKDNKLISFEEIAYIDGTKFVQINNITPPQNYEWKLFFTIKNDQFDEIDLRDYNDEEVSIFLAAKNNKIDITNAERDLNLVDGAVFEFELVKTTN